MLWMWSRSTNVLDSFIVVWCLCTWSQWGLITLVKSGYWIFWQTKSVYTWDVKQFISFIDGSYPTFLCYVIRTVWYESEHEWITYFYNAVLFAILIHCLWSIQKWIYSFAIKGPFPYLDLYFGDTLLKHSRFQVKILLIPEY